MIDAIRGEASLAVFSINLDRADDRLPAMRRQLRGFGFQFERVPAIDGVGIEFPTADFDEPAFRFKHGHRCNPAEVDCSLSRMAAILDVVPNADVVKLFTRGSRDFLVPAARAPGDEVCRCVHGPQGSAACYVATRQRAGKMRARFARTVAPIPSAKRAAVRKEDAFRGHLALSR